MSTLRLYFFKRTFPPDFRPKQRDSFYRNARPVSTTFVIFFETRWPALSSGAVWESRRFTRHCQQLSEIYFSMIPRVCFPSVRSGNLKKLAPLVNHFLKVFFRAPPDKRPSGFRLATSIQDTRSAMLLNQTILQWSVHLAFTQCGLGN